MTHSIERRAFLGGALIAALAGPRLALAAGPDVVKIGSNGILSDAVFFIADEKGYFAEQGIKAEIIPFESGPQMIAPLWSGQLDVAAGASSAGLYNAIGRGVDIKIVADKGSTPPGYEYVPILVRKDLVDSGKVKSFADFKGLKIGQGPKGGSQTATLNEALKKGGLTLKDVEQIYMTYPQHVLALTNRAIDACITTEPSSTQALNAGVAVKFTDATIYPNQQVAVLLFGGQFVKTRRELGRRFMIAYIKAARYYNDALKDGHLAGRTSADVVKIMIAKTRIKDAALYAKMVPNGLNPDGHLNVDGLRRDLEFFAEQGYIDKPVALESAIDGSFAQEAVKILGSYHPNN
jgi:NitT/TauT family transport system substrate-binding protein